MPKDDKKSKNRLKKKLKQPKPPDPKLLGSGAAEKTGSRIKKRGKRYKDLTKELGI